MSDGEINYQCWVCPKCSDDHLMDGPCSPPNTKPFSPSPDDNSYIAVKFRELESELSRYKEAVKVMRHYLNAMKGGIMLDGSHVGIPTMLNAERCLEEADRILNLKQEEKNNERK